MASGDCCIIVQNFCQGMNSITYDRSRWMDRNTTCTWTATQKSAHLGKTLSLLPLVDAYKTTWTTDREPLIGVASKCIYFYPVLMEVALPDEPFEMTWKTLWLNSTSRNTLFVVLLYVWTGINELSDNQWLSTFVASIEEVHTLSVISEKKIIL